MPRGIEVVDGDLETALRKFKKISNETRQEKKRHYFYLRPGLAKREKSKNAQKKLQSKKNKNRY